jgi:hypothetical protein
MDTVKYGYKPEDLVAAENIIDIQLAKLKKATKKNDWPSACAAIRALQGEIDHASSIAGALTLSAHLESQEPRFASLRRPS